MCATPTHASALNSHTATIARHLHRPHLSTHCTPPSFPPHARAHRSADAGDLNYPSWEMIKADKRRPRHVRSARSFGWWMSRLCMPSTATYEEALRNVTGYEPSGEFGSGALAQATEGGGTEGAAAEDTLAPDAQGVMAPGATDVLYGRCYDSSWFPPDVPSRAEVPLYDWLNETVVVSAKFVFCFCTALVSNTKCQTAGARHRGGGLNSWPGPPCFHPVGQSERVLPWVRVQTGATSDRARDELWAIVLKYAACKRRRALEPTRRGTKKMMLLARSSLLMLASTLTPCVRHRADFKWLAGGMLLFFVLTFLAETFLLCFMREKLEAYLDAAASWSAATGGIRHLSSGDKSHGLGGSSASWEAKASSEPSKAARSSAGGAATSARGSKGARSPPREVSMGALPEAEAPSPSKIGSSSKLEANLGAAKPMYEPQAQPAGGGGGGAGLPPGAPPPPSDCGDDATARVTRAPPELPDDESQSALALGGTSQAGDPGEVTFSF